MLVRHCLCLSFLLPFAVWLQSAGALSQEHEKPPQQVLILNSYHLGYGWSDEEMAGLLEAFHGYDAELEPFVEYLDCKHFPGDEHFAPLVELFRKRYAGVRLSVVLVADNPALEFALKYRAELFPDVPIVFCGINGYEPAMLRGQKRVTGVAEELDVAGTLSLALRLHPHVKEVMVVHDYTVTGLATRRAVDAAVPQFASRATFDFMPDLPMAEILARLGNLRAGTLVLITSFANDKSGQVFDHPKLAELFGAHCSAPMYAVHEARLGHGVVGGSMLGGRYHAQRAAGVALRILQGADPDTIPVDVATVSRPMFDYAQLQRFGVPLDALPAGSVVINEPQSFYFRHRVLVWSTLAVIASLALVIFVLTANILRRRRAEAALAESERRYRSLVENSPVSLWEQDLSAVKARLDSLRRAGVTDLKAYLDEHREVIEECIAALRLLDVNQAAVRLCEAPSKEALIADARKRFTPESYPSLAAVFAAIGDGQASSEHEMVIATFNGAARHVVVRWSAAPGHEQRLDRVLISYADISERWRNEEERRKLEAKLQQAQKLESLGILAGGIAHDFNNLLTGVLGYASLALQQLSPLTPARDSIRSIETAANRAADLTRLMLAYSGKGKFLVETLNLSAIVKEMAHLLEISISKKCALRYQFADKIPRVDADATQLRQVVMNLIINGAEAIGDKEGVITIAAGAVECDRAYLAGCVLDDDLPPGQYVYLDVTDTGCGMTPEVRGRIFDPFYTTKFTGRGLGLAAVLGIIRGHRGAIRVASEPGRGTTFRVLLPASKTVRKTQVIAKPPSARVRGSGTVLVVDDEESVRSFARKVLEMNGFSVLCAADGKEGLETFKANVDNVSLILLDLTMPRMTGEEAFAAMQYVRDTVPIIVSSGYSEQETTQRFAGMPVACFIQKPYTMQALTDAVHKALGK